MSYLVYFFVALIAAWSVLFGLDSVPAPMSPMPASPYALRAAVPPPPGASAIASVEPKAESVEAAKPGVVAAKPPAAVAARPAPGPGPAAPTALDRQPASILAAEPGSAAAPVANAAPPACNVAVCAAAYRSFTAADCTYQPGDGPRRLCTKGAPPAAPVAAVPPSPAPISPATTATAPAAEARALACNVAACSRSYPRSFNAADCTFKPAEGPRKVCAK